MPKLITGPGQIEWNGLLMGDGTEYFVQSLTGWRETPGMDVGSENRPLVHGAWPGRVLAQERVVTAEITIAGGDVAAAVAALEQATMPSDDAAEHELAVADVDATPRVAFGQVTRRSVPLATGYGVRMPGVAVQWNCADPRLYGVAERHVSTGLPSSGGGLSYPLTYRLDYGAAGSTGNVRVDNAGNVASAPDLLITGPCTQPRVTNQTTGKSLEFGLVLGPEDKLRVDCRQGAAVLNGAADRLYTISGRSVPPEEFDLAPMRNDIAFRSTAGGAGAQLAVSWRDAWL